MNLTENYQNLCQGFARGIVFVAPLAITITFLLWLAGIMEAIMGTILQIFIPPNWYLPGMGLVSGIVLTILIGLLANVYLVRWWIRSVEKSFDRMPLLKYLYQAAKDITRLMSTNAKDNLGAVVVLEINDIKMIGFILQKESPAVENAFTSETEQENLLAVFVPMSYQMGGYTVYVQKSQVTEIDVAAGDALRAILTGGSFDKEKQKLGHP